MITSPPISVIKQTILRVLQPPRSLYVYLSLCLALICYYLLSWPIEARDTDLWYHLSGGRYFFTQGELPRTTFYSFLLPTREYVDYYWLFQVLVYKVFSWGDYLGLLMLKAVVFMALVFFIFRFLFQKQSEQKNYFYLAIIFTLYILLFLFRFSEIRPYIFGYLFIVLSLHLFEWARERIPRGVPLFLLPLLAVLWCNIHGIAYPIILVLTFSYLTEFFICLFRKKERVQPHHLRYIIPALLTIAAIYVTPHGANLLAVPLTPTLFTSEYINELRTIQIADLFFFQLSSSGLFWQSVINLLIVLAAISLYRSVRRGQMRISHLLLVAGGILFLSKGVRFYFEFALLLLPVFRSNPFTIPVIDDHKKVNITWAIFLALILLSPVVVLANYYKNPPHYPFSVNRLPQGIITFLNKIPAQGKVLNHPNLGGYLQWTLYPKYKIFMDMQVPFVFKDEDLHAGVLAFSHPEVLSRLIDRYEPTFIMPYLLNKDVRQCMKKYPQYKLVYFDYVAALYMRADHYPELAREYELKNIDPFELVEKNSSPITGAENPQGFIEDVSNLLNIYPECFMGNQLMAMVYLNNHEFKKALFHAEVIIRHFPENKMGYLIKGDALQGLTSPEAAIQSYQKALDRTDGSGESEIFKRIGYAYGSNQEHEKAYRFMKKGISVFSSGTTLQELLDLSSAALLSERYDEAYSLLQFASQKVPAVDKEMERSIQEQLSRFHKPRSVFW